ncbi:hypothetical protein D3C81_1557940 [compost metagenome]
MILSRADTPEHELLRHLHRQLTAVGLRNQVEHQINRGGAARAGDTPPIDFEQLLGSLQAWVVFLERFQRFPVHGSAVAVEQAGLGQHHRAGIDATEYHPVMIQTAQRLLQWRPITGQRLETGDDQQNTARLARAQRRIGVYRHPIAGLHRAAIQAQHLPAVRRAFEPVGHAQWFQRTDKAHGREAWQQQEMNDLRHCCAPQ